MLQFDGFNQSETSGDIYIYREVFNDVFFQMKLSCITRNPDPQESLAGKPVELELAYATQAWPSGEYTRGTWSP